MAVGTALRATLVGVLVLAAAACGDDDGSTSGQRQPEPLPQPAEPRFDGHPDHRRRRGPGNDHHRRSRERARGGAVRPAGRADLGGDLASSLKTALQTAFNNLQDTVQDLPSDETVADAGSSVENGVQQLDTAWTNALDALNCSSSS
jgi:hypothetical protein